MGNGRVFRLVQRLLQRRQHIEAEAGDDQLFNQPLQRAAIHIQQRQQAAVLRQFAQMIEPQRHHLAREALSCGADVMLRGRRLGQRRIAKEIEFKSDAEMLRGGLGADRGGRGRRVMLAEPELTQRFARRLQPLQQFAVQAGAVLQTLQQGIGDGLPARSLFGARLGVSPGEQSTLQHAVLQGA